MESRAPASPDVPEEAVETYLRRLNGRAWGIALGVLSGLALFFATIVLVWRGGPNVGQHLNLLSVYFPGYRVSILGSLIGFVYAFVVGYATGRVLCGVYNKVAR